MFHSEFFYGVAAVPVGKNRVVQGDRLRFYIGENLLHFRGEGFLKHRRSANSVGKQKTAAIEIFT